MAGDDLNESGDLGQVDPKPRKIVSVAVKPPFFSGSKGSEPHDFLNEFECAAQANAWDEPTFIAQFRAHLTGAARNWLTSVSNERERNGDPAWTKKSLLKEFLESG